MRSLSVAMLLAVSGVSIGCGSSPTAPVEQSPGFAPLSISGQVTPLFSDAGVAGVRLTSASLSVDVFTGTDGRFSFGGPAANGAGFGLLVDRSGFIGRRLFVPAISAANLRIDLIQDVPPFDLEFYGQLVYNGLTRPEELAGRERFRQTGPLAWFIQTITDDTGEPVTMAELDYVEDQIRRSVPAWSGGQFSTEIIERGMTPRAGSTIVRFENVQRENPLFGKNYCGYASVGTPGSIMLPRNCLGILTGGRGNRIVSHEVGHVMGFSHVRDASRSVMGLDYFGDAFPNFPTADDQFHARISYSRPRQSRYPDSDPPGSFSATSSSAGQSTVFCRSPSAR